MTFSVTGCQAVSRLSSWRVTSVLLAVALQTAIYAQSPAPDVMDQLRATTAGWSRNPRRLYDDVSGPG